MKRSVRWTALLVTMNWIKSLLLRSTSSQLLAITSASEVINALEHPTLKLQLHSGWSRLRYAEVAASSKGVFGLLRLAFAAACYAAARTLLWTCAGILARITPLAPFEAPSASFSPNLILILLSLAILIGASGMAST